MLWRQPSQPLSRSSLLLQISASSTYKEEQTTLRPEGVRRADYHSYIFPSETGFDRIPGKCASSIFTGFHYVRCAGHRRESTRAYVEPFLCPSQVSIEPTVYLEHETTLVCMIRQLYLTFRSFAHGGQSFSTFPWHPGLCISFLYT